MNVEDRIAEALGSRLGTYIRQAELALMAKKAEVLKPYGLSVAQYAALHALSVAPLSGAQLARVACVTPQSMASMLTTLEAKEFIERMPSDNHAQVMVASLTPSGSALFKKANAVALKVEADLSAAFSETDERRLRTLLHRVTDVLST